MRISERAGDLGAARAAGGRARVAGLALAVLATLAVAASATRAAHAQTRLPGAAQTVEDTVRRARVVVVAELTDAGQRDVGPPGATLHQAARARVVQTLSGRAPDPLEFDFIVQTMPPGVVEATPQVGQQYILILARSGGGNTLRAVRILEATAANRAAVQRVTARPRRQ